MFENGIVSRIVDNLPVIGEAVPSVIDPAAWRRVVYRLVSDRPRFEQDYMDFRPNMKYRRDALDTLDFRKVDPSVKDYLKCFILENLDQGNHVSTEHTRLLRMRRLLTPLLEMCENHSFLAVTTDDILEAISVRWPDALTSQAHVLSDMISFNDFLRNELHVFLSVDSDTLFESYQFISDCLSGFGGTKHSVVIPDENLVDIMTGFDAVMRDEAAPMSMRMTAGMMLVDTQLGLRTEEIPALETDCVKDFECVDGKVRKGVEYNCMKMAPSFTEAVKQRTICTPICRRTIDYMLELRRRIPGSDRNPFLFVINEKCADGRVYPKEHFRLLYRKLCGTLLEHLFVNPIGTIGATRAYFTKNLSKKEYAVYYKSLYIPNLYCFRVTFATLLYRSRKLSVDQINAIMSHKPGSNVDGSYIMTPYDRDEVAADKQDLFLDVPGMEGAFDTFDNINLEQI